MVFRRLCVVVFAVLAPLASVLASPAAAQEEWPQYSRDDDMGVSCSVTTYEDGAQERSCDDGSFGSLFADGSSNWYDAASGCQIDVDTAGEIVYDSCAEGGGDDPDDGSSNQVYDEATGCWINEYGDGSSDQNCDDGSSVWNSSDGSGVRYDAGSGCSSEWDSSGTVFNEWCDDGGGDGGDGGDGGGEQSGEYDEATGCWINDYGDGNSDQNCDDGSWGGNSGDGSGYWFDGASGCYNEWDSSGATVDELCDDGGEGGDGGDGGVFDAVSG